MGKVFDYYGYENVKELWDNPDCLAILEAKGLPEGIGHITLEKFCENLKKNMEIVKEIVLDGRYSPEISREVHVKKNGQSVCFTGALTTMGRKEASVMAEKAGFEVKSGVSRGLTYLVTNDPNSGSSKNQKARAFGTKIINEQEFLKLVKTEDMEVFDL